MFLNRSNIRRTMLLEKNPGRSSKERSRHYWLFHGVRDTLHAEAQSTKQRTRMNDKLVHMSIIVQKQGKKKQNRTEQNRGEEIRIGQKEMR